MKRNRNERSYETAKSTSEWFDRLKARKDSPKTIGSHRVFIDKPWKGTS